MKKNESNVRESKMIWMRGSRWIYRGLKVKQGCKEIKIERDRECEVTKASYLRDAENQNTDRCVETKSQSPSKRSMSH